MKKVIIYTTKDEVISLHLVNSIVTDPKFENCKIDIKLSNPSFLRKIKILLVIIFFGSIKTFFKNLKNKISLTEILNNNKNCKVVKNVIGEYDYGLSVYCSEKIQMQNFKIYNFHLGSLKNQGDLLFFFINLLKIGTKFLSLFMKLVKNLMLAKL